VTVLHRVRARNIATASANKIHDDAVARRYGFAGGLVPGVDVFAYATHPVVEHFGARWLEEGAMRVRFRQPVYDGHETTVEGAWTSGDTTLSLVVRDDFGAECATATATEAAETRDAPDPDAYEPAPLPPPQARPRASADSLAPGRVLGSLEQTFRAQVAAEYLDAIGETLALYRTEGWAHPGWLLRRANRILAANVELGPWIHVGSELRFFGVVRDGDSVWTRGKTVRAWEHRGHKFVTIDVLVGCDRGAAMHAEHTAIYEPRQTADPRN
jgi:hypothetical protein